MASFPRCCRHGQEGEGSSRGHSADLKFDHSPCDPSIALHGVCDNSYACLLCVKLFGSIQANDDYVAEKTSRAQHILYLCQHMREMSLLAHVKMFTFRLFVHRVVWSCTLTPNSRLILEPGAENPVLSPFLIKA
ncbi:uncharacterized protein LOC143766095 isoform X2 [Ranitomeya variabilis]|uniref:uncharacterized protein LOC143766095 isoform X2 n=1 Tax=Ranitomeya variabilis TaxID=490064 RepID=UPI00405623CB